MSERTKMMAGNWKMHKTLAEAQELAGFSLDGHELVLDCAAIVARPCLAGCRPAPGLLSRNVFDQVTGIARALALERAGVCRAYRLSVVSYCFFLRMFE